MALLRAGEGDDRHAERCREEREVTDRRRRLIVLDRRDALERYAARLGELVLRPSTLLALEPNARADRQRDASSARGVVLHPYEDSDRAANYNKPTSRQRSRNLYVFVGDFAS